MQLQQIELLGVANGNASTQESVIKFKEIPHITHLGSHLKCFVGYRLLLFISNTHKMTCWCISCNKCPFMRALSDMYLQPDCATW